MASENDDPQFPDDLVAECVRRYRRATREHPQFSQARVDGRSFPTGYCIGEPGETIPEHIEHVLAELGEPQDRWEQASQSLAADFRVFAGASDADASELPHIDDAYCVAEFICDEKLGIRVDTWTEAEADPRLARVHVRYGVALDWITRDVAQLLARDRDGAGPRARYKRYGLCPYRVALEHGAEPYELEEIAVRTTLRTPGMVVRPEQMPFRRTLGDRILRRLSGRLRELPPERPPC